MITKLFLVPLAFALQAPDFTVSVSGTEVTALPPPGHHFNIQAPATLSEGAKILKPVSAQEKKVVFHLTQKTQNFTVSLFLCDDAKSFCEKHQVGANPSAKQPNDSKSQVFKGTKNGFIFNQPEEALAQAARENKPLIIDFYGIWCPPCNMLDEEIFSKPDFQKETSRFVRLKLDADAPASWELKSKYKIGGYPTIVFTTSTGDEINRMVGFRPKKEFLKAVQGAWDGRANSFSVLKTQADQGDKKSAAALGKLHLVRKEYSEAKKYLSQSSPGSEDLFNAEIGTLEEDESKLAEKLQEAITAFPNSLDALERRSKLATIFESKNQTQKRNEQLEIIVKDCRNLAKHPEKMKSSDLSVGDLLGMAADAQEQLGKKEEARKTWREAAEEYQNQIGKLGKSQADGERGYNIELAYCLWKGGEAPAADTLYRKLEKRYPNEFTFYFGHARMKMELKKFDEAKQLAQKAFEYSYGDNRLRAGHLLAQTFEATGQKDKGIETVRETLKTVSIPDDKEIRTHRYVKKLNDLLKKLE